MMRRLLCAALLALPPALLCAAVRLLPSFAAHWSNWVARPILKTISSVGGRLPFSLMEWGMLALILVLCIGFILRLCRQGVMHAIVHLLRRICTLLMALVWLLATLWYPLYVAEAPLQITATPAQLAALERFVTGQVAAMIDEILSGKTQPNPVDRGPADSACRWCDYSSACHKDVCAVSPRRFAAVKADEFWQEIERRQRHG